jgi:glutathione S-transferase
VAFVSRLVEDYADEWLWRPAMHYRWSYPETARLMSAWLSEHAREQPAPGWLKRRFWRRRQFGTFVRGDGVTASTRAAVEASYLDTLAALEGVFARRSFVLGERPTEADFGFFASLFRHFFSDPAPARIMRDRAPGVQEWVARMWNLRPERFASLPLPDRVPDDLDGIFAAITRVYLPISKPTPPPTRAARRPSAIAYRTPSSSSRPKPYRVWWPQIRSQRDLVALDASGARRGRARVQVHATRSAEPRAGRRRKPVRERDRDRCR